MASGIVIVFCSDTDPASNKSRMAWARDTEARVNRAVTFVSFPR